MAFTLRTTLRAAARKHAPLRLLADVYRYLGYRYRLARQDRVETASPASLPPPRLRHRVHGAMERRAADRSASERICLGESQP